MCGSGDEKIDLGDRLKNLRLVPSRFGVVMSRTEGFSYIFVDWVYQRGCPKAQSFGYK